MPQNAHEVDAHRLQRAEAELQEVRQLANKLAQTLAVVEIKYSEITRVSDRIEDFISKSEQRDLALINRITGIIDERDRRLMLNLDHHNSTHSKAMAVIEKSYTDRCAGLDTDIAEVKTAHETLDQKVTTMEKWQWMVTGGAVVAATVIQKLIEII